MSVGSGSLFSIFLLCRIMDMAYCMAMMLISSNGCLVFIFGDLKYDFNIFHRRGVCGCPSTSRDDY